MFGEDPFVSTPNSKATDKDDGDSLDSGSGRSSPAVASLASVVVLKQRKASCVKVASSARSSFASMFKTPEKHFARETVSRASSMSSQAMESVGYETACSSRCSESRPGQSPNRSINSPPSNILITTPHGAVCDKSEDTFAARSSMQDSSFPMISEQIESDSVSRSFTDVSDLGRLAQNPRRLSLRPRLRPLSMIASNGLARQNQGKVRTTDRGQKSMVLIRNMLSATCASDVEFGNRIEVHLKIVTYELQARLNRIDALEREAQVAKKDVLAKSLMISGLTRERHSLVRASGADFSIIPELRAEIRRHQDEVKALRETIASLQSQLEESSCEVQASEKAHVETKQNHDDLLVKSEFLELENDRYQNYCRSQVETHASEIASMKLAHNNALESYEGKLSSKTQEHNGTVAALHREIEELRLSVRRLAISSFRKNSRDRFSVDMDAQKASTASRLSTTETDAVSLSFSTSTSATIPSPATPTLSVFSPTPNVKSSWPDQTQPVLQQRQPSDPAEGQKLQEAQTLIETLTKRSKEDKDLIALLETALTDVEQQSNYAKAEVHDWRNQALRMQNELTNLRMSRVIGARQSMVQRSGSTKSTATKRQSKYQKQDGKEVKGSPAVELATKELEMNMGILAKKKKKSRRPGLLTCF